MRLTVLAFVLALAGCATAYQPQGATGGFSEMRRGDFTYLVRFNGNGYTSRDTAEEMTFLRAAELTREKGFKYFAILDESASTTTSTFTTPARTVTSGSVDPFGNFRARSTTFGGNTYDVNRPSTRMLIGVANDKVGAYDWIDAARVIDELGPKYKLAGPKSAPAAGSDNAKPVESGCFLRTDGKCMDGSEPKR